MNILIALLLLLPCTALGADKYVSTLGSDSYDGTSPTHTTGTDGPYATIQKCIANLTTGGDTCFIVAGTYNENVDFSSAQSVPSGSSGNELVLKPYSGGEVIIDTDTCTLDGTAWKDRCWAMRDVSYWIIEDLIFQKGAGIYMHLGDRNSGTPSSGTDLASYITFTNVTWRNHRYNAVEMDNADNITFNGCTWKNVRKYRVYKTGSSSPHTSEGNATGINAKLRATNITLTNSTFIDGGGEDAIHTRPQERLENYNIQDWTITDNVFSYTSPYVETDPDTGSIVSPPRFFGVGENFIDMKRGENWTIRGNIFMGTRPNTAYRYYKTPGTAGSMNKSGTDLAFVSDGITSSSNDLLSIFTDTNSGLTAPSVVVEGSTSNDGWYRITAITAGKITLLAADTGGGLTIEDGLADTWINYETDMEGGSDGSVIVMHQEARGGHIIERNVFENTEGGLTVGSPVAVASNDMVFTVPNTITNSGSQTSGNFTYFTSGDTFTVTVGGGSNNGNTFTVDTVAATTLTTIEQTIANQSSGSATLAKNFIRLDGTVVRNNIFRENQKAPYRGSGSCGVFWLRPYKTSGLSVYNNTFVTNDAAIKIQDISNCNTRLAWSIGAVEDTNHIRNLYYSNVVVGGEIVIGNVIDNRFWNNAFDGVTLSGGKPTTGSFANRNMDLKIQSDGTPSVGSPVIGASFYNGLTVDHYGNARGNTPSIGAVEVEPSAQ